MRRARSVDCRALRCGSGRERVTGRAVPAHPKGHAYTDWTKAVGQFFLGDASNPLVAGPLIAGLGGDCGQQRNGVFMMVGPIELNAEFGCDVPTGTWIVFSHAGFFATEGVDADTDAELEALARRVQDVRRHAHLRREAHPAPVFDTGASDVISQKGSFYDAVSYIVITSFPTVCCSAKSAIAWAASASG